VLIGNILEKSILRNTGNVVFPKSWKHIVKNAPTDVFFTEQLKLSLEKLHKEEQGQLGHYIKLHYRGVMPLVPSDTLYNYKMEGLK
jgi:hypothetical protein